MSFKLLEPLIYLITSGETNAANIETRGREIVEIVSVAVKEQIPLVQLRERSLQSKALFELVRHLAQITGGSKTRLLVNDRSDVAAAAGADGVHLTSKSIPVTEVRKSFGRDFLIAISTHTIDEVIDASRHGADLAVFGPVFESPGKTDLKGIATLSRACKAANGFTVVGLGGIDESNYEQVLRAGASGVAAIRSLNNAEAIRSFAKKVIDDRAH